MALETLKGITQIDGFDIKRVSWHLPEGTFIEVNDDCNAITFKIQNGPIKENGVNGCQVDTLIEAARIMIEKLNEQYPCMENGQAGVHLESALRWLSIRKADRERRGVEGFNKA